MFADYGRNATEEEYHVIIFWCFIFTLILFTVSTFLVFSLSHLRPLSSRSVPLIVLQHVCGLFFLVSHTARANVGSKSYPCSPTVVTGIIAVGGLSVAYVCRVIQLRAAMNLEIEGNLFMMSRRNKTKSMVVDGKNGNGHNSAMLFEDSDDKSKDNTTAATSNNNENQYEVENQQNVSTNDRDTPYLSAGADTMKAAAAKNRVRNSMITANSIEIKVDPESPPCDDDPSSDVFTSLAYAERTLMLRLSREAGSTRNLYRSVSLSDVKDAAEKARSGYYFVRVFLPALLLHACVAIAVLFISPDTRDDPFGACNFESAITFIIFIIVAVADVLVVIAYALRCRKIKDGLMIAKEISVGLASWGIFLLSYLLTAIILKIISPNMSTYPISFLMFAGFCAAIVVNMLWPAWMAMYDKRFSKSTSAKDEESSSSSSNNSNNNNKNKNKKKKNKKEQRSSRSKTPHYALNDSSAGEDSNSAANVDIDGDNEGEGEGPPIPPDATLQEVLESPVWIERLREFLVREFSVESLLFLEEAWSFKDMCKPPQGNGDDANDDNESNNNESECNNDKNDNDNNDNNDDNDNQDAEIIKHFNEIFMAYICSDAPMVINIDGHTRGDLIAVHSAKGTPPLNVFDKAIDIVVAHLEMDTFPRFCRAEIKRQQQLAMHA